MAYLPIMTVPYEGAYYALGRVANMPIRIYADRSVQDDIAASFTGKVRRERLSKRDFRAVKRAAKANAREGWS